jgi:molybdopterin-guanine dinucleotide biosynthesis protein B
MQTVIAVVGGKKSGKTTTIEILTKELANRGYRIAVAKHIPEPNFTIDKEGKDTWRYAQSGAETVIAFSADEIATVEKFHAKDLSLKEILQRCNGSDVVFLEGFRQLIARLEDVYKIVVVKSDDDVAEAVKMFEPILAFTGPHVPRIGSKTPYFDIFKHAKKIADLIESLVKGKP